MGATISQRRGTSSPLSGERWRRVPGRSGRSTRKLALHSFGWRSVVYPLLIGTMDLVDRSVAWGNSAQAMPFTAIFGRDGQLASVHLGRMSEDALERAIKALLGP